MNRYVLPDKEVIICGGRERNLGELHPLIFHALGNKALGPKAAALFDRCERQEAVVYVPAAVIWEVSLLARVSRINLRRTARAFFDDLFSNPAYHPLDLTPERSPDGIRLQIPQLNTYAIVVAE